MQSRAKLLGHPVHQMLVVLPLGLFIMAVLFDLADVALDRMTFATASYWNIAAGVATGLLAAVFGAVDWFAIPAKTRAKRIGAIHGLGNVIVVALFTIVLALRWREFGHDTTRFALLLELCAFLMGAVTGWLGGELVDRMGIGVDAGAHANAPNSITHKKIGAPAVPVVHVG